MANDEMRTVFDERNRTELESYLIEITHDILGNKDDAGQKGTDK